MTIELSKETEALLEKVLSGGSFETAEQFLRYSLTRTLTEQEIFGDETFNERMRKALAEAQDDIDNGRVRRFTKENHHTLYADVIRRGKERVKAEEAALDKG